MKLYSKSNQAFYDEDINSGKIPGDAKEISDDLWRQMLDGESAGKVISSDKNGLPILTDPEPETQEQLISTAESQKAALRAVADAEITPLQYASDLDMATESEKESLLSWQKYVVLLNRVDTSKAPDITWPDKP